MLIAEHPLHRSGRAALPHPAPALGDERQALGGPGMALLPVSHCCLTYPLERAGHALPALRPVHVALGRVPLGQPPLLHRLRGRFFGVVRRLPSSYGAVRLPASVHHRLSSLDFPMRSAAPSAADERGISRFPCEVLPCVPGVFDRAGSHRASRWRRVGCGLPPSSTASAPRSNPPCGGAWISRLDTQPARPPVNASPVELPPPAHDSGPSWAANPSTYDSFIHYTSPV